jgi:hypothetical protein
MRNHGKCYRLAAFATIALAAASSAAVSAQTLDKKVLSLV